MGIPSCRRECVWRGRLGKALVVSGWPTDLPGVTGVVSGARVCMCQHHAQRGGQQWQATCKGGQGPGKGSAKSHREGHMEHPRHHQSSHQPLGSYWWTSSASSGVHTCSKVLAVQNKAPLPSILTHFHFQWVNILAKVTIELKLGKGWISSLVWGSGPGFDPSSMIYTWF